MQQEIYQQKNLLKIDYKEEQKHLNDWVEEQAQYLTQKIQKQQKALIQQEFQELCKKYEPEYNRDEIWVIFQAIQFEKKIVDYIMQNRNQTYIKSIKKELIKFPQKGQQNLQKIISEYCQRNGIQNWQKVKTIFYKIYLQEREKRKQQKIDNFKKPQQNQQLNIQENSTGLLGNLGDYLIIYLLEYADIITLGNFQRVCKRFQIIVRSKFIFKPICLELFTTGPPKLPELDDSPYKKLTQYVIENQNQYSLEQIQQVTENVRDFIWDEAPQAFKTPTSYFKQYKGWYSMFLSAPKVNYAGIYRLKETYAKSGELKLDQWQAQQIEVYYFRYLRFFPDGTFVQKVSNKKLTKDQVVSSLLYQNLQDPKNEALIGEYRSCRDRLVLKYVQQATIFEMELKIQHEMALPNNTLLLEFSIQKNPEINYSSVLFKDGPLVQPRFFKYIPLQEIRDNIQNRRIAAMTL